MDLGIEGRRAAVAAGSAGLGLGSARALDAEGVAVAICGRDPARIDRALESLSDRAVGVQADVSTESGARGFVTAAAERLGGPPDILVANAGGPPPGNFSSTAMDDYRAALDLNMLSTIAMCLEAVPAMQEAGWGRVVAITSVGAKEPIDGLIASSTARAGLTAFLGVTAREVAEHGVTVNSVLPGSHDTERIRSLRGGAVADPSDLTIGNADDFGAVVAFLCSRQARFVNGATVTVDGGRSRGMF